MVRYEGLQPEGGWSKRGVRKAASHSKFWVMCIYPQRNPGEGCPVLSVSLLAKVSTMRRFILQAIISLAAMVLMGTTRPGPAAAEVPQGVDFFEKQIRPLLAKQCYLCHSATSQPLMSELRLDSRENLLQGGSRGPAIVPGHPEKSLLIAAIGYGDPKLRMPPTGKLKEAEIAALTAWVKMGAPWGTAVAQGDASPRASEPFWAFRPPIDAPIPAVSNSRWPKSPLDHFVLAALEAKGITPAPPASRQALIRRATFDLTGLPPTPAEINAFLADDSPDAFARVVEHLLASLRYGERWGRHWLDVARYADSNGLDENLVFKNAYRYRDYVIEAFNKDKPYDQFIHEQLAGDLLPSAAHEATRYERLIATGFLALGAKMLAEDDPVKMEMNIIDEQVDTMGRAFMGLTLGCARCHNHKFDPISIADYYSLAGIFKSSKTMENFKVVAKWHEYVLAPKADRERLQAHEEKIEAKKKQIEALTKPANEQLIADARRQAASYLLAASALLRHEEVVLKPVLSESGGDQTPGLVLLEAENFERGNVKKDFTTYGNPIGVVVGAEKVTNFAEYDFSLPHAGLYQLELRYAVKQFWPTRLLVNGELVKAQAATEPTGGLTPETQTWSVEGIFSLRTGKNTIRLEREGRWPHFDKLLVAPRKLPAGAPLPKTPVQLAAESGLIPDLIVQWAEYLRRTKTVLSSVMRAWHTYGAGASSSLDSSSPISGLFGDFTPSSAERLAARYQQLFDEADRAWKALHQKPEGAGEEAKETKLPDPAQEALREVLYDKHGPFGGPAKPIRYYSAETAAEVKRLEEELKSMEESTPEFPRAMGVTEGEITNLAIHLRGSHLTLGREVPRWFLQVIAGEKQTPIDNRQSGRLHLAKWLTRPDHPLTSRVMVNRIWRWHFGVGIVPSTDNFGKARRAADQPTTAGLVGPTVRRFRLVHQVHASSDYALQYLPDEHHLQQEGLRGGPGKPIDVADKSAPAGSRSHS